MPLPGRVIHLFLLVIFLISSATTSLSGRTLSVESSATASASYDVIVVGGDAEGVAAAIGAARAGASTLLIDTRKKPGGLLTRGWLNTIDLNLDRNRRPLNGGIFAELYGNLQDHSFDTAHMETLLEQLLSRETRLDLITGVMTVLPVVGSESLPLFRPGQTLQPEGQTIPTSIVTTRQPVQMQASSAITLSGVEIYPTNARPFKIMGKRLIDATQDADLAAAAGAGWIAYGEDIWGTPKNMATTLTFCLSGISDKDWQYMCQELRRQKYSGKLSGGKRNSVWGFGTVMQQYIPSTSRIRVRGLNLGRQNNGTVLVNSLLVFGIDGLNNDSRKEARRLAETELPRLLPFLQQRIPGMAAAQISGTATELYVRTSRQIKTIYTLTVDDVLENRDFPDRIGFGSYPLDIQAQSKDQPGDVTGKPEQYAVPLRSLIPIGFTNLLVVGRSAGFDSLAQSSARTIPVGMAAGQGAGVTAAVSINRDLTCPEIIASPSVIAEIHQLLASQGVQITANTAQPPSLVKHWAYPGLKFLRRRGQISGGYANSYQLDDAIPIKAFANRLTNLRSDLDKLIIKKIFDATALTEPFTLGMACSMLAEVDRQASATELLSPAVIASESAAIVEFYKNQGLFAAPWPVEHLNPDKPITRGAAYMLLMRWHAGKKD